MESVINWLNSFVETIRSPKNEWLAAKTIAIAFGFNAIILLKIGTLISQNPLVDIIISQVGGICFWFFLGVAGVIVAIRKEIHQVITIRGNLALFYGVIWCLFSWSLTIYILTSLLQLLYSK